MKKLLMTAMLVLLSLPAMAQRIIADKTNEDGSRMVMSDSEWVRTGFTDRNPISYGVSYIKLSDGTELYYIDIKINVGYNFELPKDGLILLKTPSGYVIEGRQVLEDYETGDLIGTRSNGITTHTITGTYRVKLDDLKRIAEEGLTKVRIEKKAEVIDIEYKEKKTNQTKEIFSSRVPLLLSALKNDTDIRSGF